MFIIDNYYVVYVNQNEKKIECDTFSLYTRLVRKHTRKYVVVKINKCTSVLTLKIR